MSCRSLRVPAFLLLILAATNPCSDAASAARPGHAQAKLTRATASTMTTAQLARLILPNEPASRFASHELIHHDWPGDDLAAVRFFARPTEVANDLCLRDSVYVELQPAKSLDVGTARSGVPMKFERVLPTVQIAAVPGCKLRTDDIFAWVQPVQALEGAQQAVRRLVALQQAATGNLPLAAKVECRTENLSDACAPGPLAVLAGLPTRRIQIINREANRWKMSILPNEPGKYFWEVLLSDEEAIPTITLNWRQPAPF